MPTIGNQKSRTKLPLVFRFEEDEIKDYRIFEPKNRGGMRNNKRYIEILLIIGENKPELCYQNKLKELYVEKSGDGISQSRFAEILDFFTKNKFIDQYENKIKTDYYKNGKKTKCYVITIKSLVALSHLDEFKPHKMLKNHKPDVSNSSFLNNIYLDLILKIPEKRLKRMLNAILEYYATVKEHNVNFVTKNTQIDLHVDSIFSQFQKYVINVALNNNFYNEKSKFSYFGKEIEKTLHNNKNEILKELEKEYGKLENQLKVNTAFKEIIMNKQKADTGLGHDYMVLCDKIMSLQIMKLKNESSIKLHGESRFNVNGNEIGKNLDIQSKIKLIEEIISEKKIYDVAEELELSDIIEKISQN